MISTIQNARLTKSIAVTLATALLFASFRTPAPGEVLLSAGTRVVLETTSSIRSNEVRVGHMVEFRVMYDVKVENQVVIAAGAVALGEVKHVDKAKEIGRQGSLQIQLNWVTAIDGQEVPLVSRSLNEEGEDRQLLSIVLSAVVFPLFLLVKGKEAHLPPGEQFTAEVATSMPIQV